MVLSRQVMRKRPEAFGLGLSAAPVGLLADPLPKWARELPSKGGNVLKLRAKANAGAGARAAEEEAAAVERTVLDDNMSIFTAI